MGCCGQGRAALRGTLTPAGANEATSATPPPLAASERRLLLQYQAAAPIAVRGVGTGRLYQFDADHARQHVAEADALPLLRSKFFARAD